jgi:hypothetical protein
MSKAIRQRKFAVAKRKLREYQQRNSLGVPLRAKKIKENRAVTLRQPLLVIVTHLRICI